MSSENGSQGPRDRPDDEYAQARKLTPVMAVETTRGARFFISTDDDVVGRILFMKGGRGEFSVLDTALETLSSLGLDSRVRGKTFLDIGANIGTSSIAALLWHPFRDAVAIEPEPRNYKLLKLNALYNDVEDRLRTLPVAVSDESGDATLWVNSVNSGAHSIRIGRERALDSKATKLAVDKVSLDDLATRGLLEPDEIGMVWIDVQGHEPLVLKGGAAVFATGVPTVIEFYPSMLETLALREVLNQAVRDHFTHFVDLREASKNDVEVLETEVLETYGSDEPDGRFTDLLLLSLPG